MLFFSSMMISHSQTKELFRRAEAVCFDVDSTVIKEEGIDELAKFCGVGDAVTEMQVYCLTCAHYFIFYTYLPCCTENKNCIDIWYDWVCSKH